MALLTDEHGFALPKAAFRDGLSLRYGWSLRNLPSYCSRGQSFSVEHALTCKTGELPAVRHNEVRDIIATLLSEVCCHWRRCSTWYGDGMVFWGENWCKGIQPWCPIELSRIPIMTSKNLTLPENVTCLMSSSTLHSQTIPMYLLQLKPLLPDSPCNHHGIYIHTKDEIYIILSTIATSKS